MRTLAIIILTAIVTLGIAGEVELNTPTPSGVTWAKIGYEDMRLDRGEAGVTFSMRVYGVTVNSNRVNTIFRETAEMPLVEVNYVQFTLAELNQAMALMTNNIEAAKGLIAKTKVTELLTQ